MCWYEQLDEKVREYLPDMTMEREVPLSRHTSFRIGGPARRMAATGGTSEREHTLPDFLWNYDSPRPFP